MEQRARHPPPTDCAKMPGSRCCSILLISLVGAASGFKPTTIATKPSPTLAPLQVVQSQLTALQAGDVQTCFAFASPTIKRATGPVESFARMLRQTPSYSPLVGCSWFVIVSGLTLSDEHWRCRVLVRPARLWPFEPCRPAVMYEWMLTKEIEPGPNTGCWMVDGVLPEVSGNDA